MPVFEYICNKCSHTFSVLILSSKQEETKCPKCGSSDIAKKISAFCCSTPSGGGTFTGGGGGGFGGG